MASSRLTKPFPKARFLRDLVYHKGEFVEFKRGLNRQEMKKLIGEIAAMSFEEIEQYDSVTLKDWVSARTNDESMHFLFLTLAGGAVMRNDGTVVAGPDHFTAPGSGAVCF